MRWMPLTKGILGTIKEGVILFLSECDLDVERKSNCHIRVDIIPYFCLRKAYTARKPFEMTAGSWGVVWPTIIWWLNLWFHHKDYYSKVAEMIYNSITDVSFIVFALKFGVKWSKLGEKHHKKSTMRALLLFIMFVWKVENVEQKILCR